MPIECTMIFFNRVPLSAEMKEVLEVAYVSRVMSKNFRREGQPEKERLAQITGMELEKVILHDCGNGKVTINFTSSPFYE